MSQRRMGCFGGSSSKDEEEEVASSSDGFFKRLFCDTKNDLEEKALSKFMEDDEKEGFFKKFFKEKFDDKKDETERNDDEEIMTKISEDDEKEGFFKKFFIEKFDNRKDGSGRTDYGNEEESSDISLFRRLFRVHPEDSKTSMTNYNSNDGNLLESNPGSANFFRKLFKDRDRSVEDSELYV